MPGLNLPCPTTGSEETNPRIQDGVRGTVVTLGATIADEFRCRALLPDSPRFDFLYGRRSAAGTWSDPDLRVDQQPPLTVSPIKAQPSSLCPIQRRTRHRTDKISAAGAAKPRQRRVHGLEDSDLMATSRQDVTNSVCTTQPQCQRVQRQSKVTPVDRSGVPSKFDELIGHAHAKWAEDRPELIIMTKRDQLAVRGSATDERSGSSLAELPLGLCELARLRLLKKSRGGREARDRERIQPKHRISLSLADWERNGLKRRARPPYIEPSTDLRRQCDGAAQGRWRTR